MDYQHVCVSLVQFMQRDTAIIATIHCHNIHMVSWATHLAVGVGNSFQWRGIQNIEGNYAENRIQQIENRLFVLFKFDFVTFLFKMSLT